MPHSSSAVQCLFRAEEARSLADEIHDELAKRTMLSIATGYDRLAEHASSLADSGLPIDEGKTDALD
jgi:hypothetical protein